jgi:hypothetical protein
MITLSPAFDRVAAASSLIRMMLTVASEKRANIGDIW